MRRATPSQLKPSPASWLGVQPIAQNFVKLVRLVAHLLSALSIHPPNGGCNFCMRSIFMTLRRF